MARSRRCREYSPTHITRCSYQQPLLESRRLAKCRVVPHLSPRELYLEPLDRVWGVGCALAHEAQAHGIGDCIALGIPQL